MPAHVAALPVQGVLHSGPSALGYVHEEHAGAEITLLHSAGVFGMACVRARQGRVMGEARRIAPERRLPSRRHGGGVQRRGVGACLGARRGRLEASAALRGEGALLSSCLYAPRGVGVNEKD